MLNWLNPHAKIQKLKKKINFDTVPLKYILLYPSKEVLLSDKILPDTDEYFALKDEISACGWGPAYQFISKKSGTTKWIKADLLKDR
jgi:hypothetical protein